MKRILLVCVLFVFVAACQSAPFKISTDMSSSGYDVLGEGEGSSTGIMLFNVIPIGQNDRFQEAYHNAVLSKGGDALLNPEISERWFWAYVLNGYITTVKGTVIKYRK
jgi:opacity protein-like surface antigen